MTTPARPFTKPEQCAPCAAGHERTACWHFPVPCEDRLGAWAAAERATRDQCSKAVDGFARRMQLKPDALVTADMLFTLAEQIREGRS